MCVGVCVMGWACKDFFLGGFRGGVGAGLAGVLVCMVCVRMVWGLGRVEESTYVWARWCVYSFALIGMLVRNLDETFMRCLTLLLSLLYCRQRE